jgi:hypothetical protein
MRTAILALTCTFALFFHKPAVPQTQTQTDTGGPSEEIIKAIILQEAMKLVSRNIDASKKENGEIDKLIRAISGISVRDIERYGLCGGPNSEVRKNFGSLC